MRLHLGFHLLDDKPAVARVSAGQLCERKAWKQSWQRGAAYVGDRYYGEDYRLFEELTAHGCHFGSPISVPRYSPPPPRWRPSTAGTLRLATNLEPGTLSAELVARR